MYWDGVLELVLHAKAQRSRLFGATQARILFSPWSGHAGNKRGIVVDDVFAVVVERVEQLRVYHDVAEPVGAAQVDHRLRGCSLLAARHERIRAEIADSTAQLPSAFDGGNAEFSGA